MMNTIKMIPIGVESDKYGISVAHVFVEVHHAFLFTDIVGVTKLVNFHDNDMRTKVNEDIGAVASTAAFYRLVAS